MSEMTAMEHAREAYLQTYVDSEERVKSGKMDWSPWIQGYAAAIQVVMDARDAAD